MTTPKHWISPVAIALALTMAGCATVPQSSSSQAIALPERGAFALETLKEPVVAAEPQPSVGTEIVMRALGLIGKPYRFGGNAPDSGFDCSGLVRWVFDEKLASELPRSSLAMSRVGKPDVSRDALQAGDLVFFRTRGRVVSHVGIYIGEGRFVHAPRRGENVRIDRIDDTYWRVRFTNAKRVLPAEASAPISASVDKAAPEISTFESPGIDTATASSR